MIVVLPFSVQDHQLARKLARWMAQLGPYTGHRAIVIKDSRINDEHEVAKTLMGCFDSVQEMTYPDDGVNTWPFSPNRIWNMVAKEIQYSAVPLPWLWLEPDAMPMRKGWLDELVKEYDSARKPFMGDYVAVADVPVHMSGVAIYPPRITEYTWKAGMATETAWDIEGAPDIVPKAHWTERIVHNWKHEPIDTESKLANLRGQHPQMVLFHSDKSGKMIDLLQAELLPSVPAKPEESTITTVTVGDTGNDEVLSGGSGARQENLIQQSDVTARPSPEDERNHSLLHASVLPAQSAAGLIYDIFIKTYPEDYRWLYFCLRSISKFATGFRKIVIVGPETVPHYLVPVTMPGKGVKSVVAGEQPDGYLWQQVIKLSADKFTDAGHICFIDCDTLFTRPVRPEEFFKDGKPIWMMTPYSKIDVPWKPIIEKFLGRPVEYEFMRRFPVMVPRWLLSELRRFCVSLHQKELDSYILEQPKSAFSEFNALGAFAYAMHRDKFHWVNTESPESEWPTLTVKQFWSKGGLTPQIKADIDTILTSLELLGGGLAEKTIPLVPTVGPPPTPPPGLKINPAWETATHEFEPVGPPPKSFAERSHEIVTEYASCETGKISDEGGPPSNGIRQTKAGWWVLEGDNFISKWVEDEGRLDHDQWLLDRIKPVSGPGETVIEVGAYIGDHTHWFLNRGCRVIACEPNPKAAECLRRNCPEAEVHEVALWYEPAQLEFENGGQKENPGASWVVEHFAGRPINAMPLDAADILMPELDLIMIDCEGSELFVLQGAQNTIRRHRPNLIIELNAGAMKRYGYTEQAIFEFLRGEGYTWQPIQPLMVADPPQYDIIARYTRTEAAQPARRQGRPRKDGQQLKPEQLEERAEMKRMVHRLKEIAETSDGGRQRVMLTLASNGLTPRWKKKKKGVKNRNETQTIPN